MGALEQYDNALEITPKMHPGRAVLDINKVMQMKRIDYEAVIAECGVALRLEL